jgi:hypothetical protein
VPSGKRRFHVENDVYTPASAIYMRAVDVYIVEIANDNAAGGVDGPELAMSDQPDKFRLSRHHSLKEIADSEGSSEAAITLTRSSEEPSQSLA